MNTYIVNAQGELSAYWKTQGGLAAMVDVINKAAEIYGEDWDNMLDALSYVFIGVRSHGLGTLLAAEQKKGN